MGINSLLNCCFKTCWVWSHDKRNAKFGIPGFMSCFHQVSVSQKLWCLMAMTAWHLLILWWWLLKNSFINLIVPQLGIIPLFYWNIKKSNFEGHRVLLHFDISSCKFSVYCRWWHRAHNGLQTLWKISKIKSFIQQTILKNEILQCLGTLLLSLVNVCRCDQRNETSWCKFDNLIASFHCNRN